jgi:hypothetical protein
MKTEINKKKKKQAMSTGLSAERNKEIFFSQKQKQLSKGNAITTRRLYMIPLHKGISSQRWL